MNFKQYYVSLSIHKCTLYIIFEWGYQKIPYFTFEKKQQHLGQKLILTILWIIICVNVKNDTDNRKLTNIQVNKFLTRCKIL